MLTANSDTSTHCAAVGEQQLPSLRCRTTVQAAEFPYRYIHLYSNPHIIRQSFPVPFCRRLHIDILLDPSLSEKQGSQKMSQSFFLKNPNTARTKLAMPGALEYLYAALGSDRRICWYDFRFCSSRKMFP